jgi:hypothetical protein
MRLAYEDRAYIQLMTNLYGDQFLSDVLDNPITSLKFDLLDDPPAMTINGLRFLLGDPGDAPVIDRALNAATPKLIDTTKPYSFDNVKRVKDVISNEDIK